MNAQRGFALMVSLVVLLALTLLAVSSINMTQVDLRIAGNMQGQQEAEERAAAFIEALLSDYDNFTNRTGVEGDITYQIACMEQRPQPGYSLKLQELPPPEIAYWHTRALYTDPAANARVALVQGVRMAMLADNPDC